MKFEIEFMHDNQVWNLVDSIDDVRKVSHESNYLIE
jgi:hypothetical protein